MSKEKTAKIINKPKEIRLYERVMDVKDFCRVLTKHSDKVVFTYFDKKRQLHDVTYGEFLHKAKSLAAAFTKRGLEGKRIAIIGETSVNWMASYVAILSVGGVAIPLDKELEISVIEGFMESVDADALVYSSSFNSKFKNAMDAHSSLSCFIPMEPTEEELALSDKIIPLNTLYEEGAVEVAAGYEIPDVKNRDALAEFLFTSGTTGTSKCVMLSQKNIFSVVTSAAATVPFTPDDTIVSLLPIHHTYELACLLAGMDYGMHICINDSITHVLKNLQIFKPTGLVLVPLYIYTFYKRIWAEAKKTGRDKKLKLGITAARSLLKVGVDKRRDLFAEVLNSFGGRLEKIVCGGAALNPRMVEFFDTLGVSIYEGYGITECAPLTCVVPYFNRKYASVGPAVPCCQVRIHDGYENEKGFIEGEIQVKGDNVMLGYYNNPEATADAFTEDGWFRTGDVGYLDEDEYCFITGRLKTVIVLENGKNVFPEEIEEYLGNIETIAESAVIGRQAGSEVNLTALVFPDATKFPEGTTKEQMQEEIQKSINELNKTLPTYKHIKVVELRDTEFEKTTSRKIKRHLLK
ncbi:MAG: long-chain fatty acid--CoA ligase [Ruminococcaceae bacterium]|nr:long-chain fatty acid--CoA ligase [Oscillospiraceae bacterium]